MMVTETCYYFRYFLLAKITLFAAVTAGLEYEANVLVFPNWDFANMYWTQHGHGVRNNWKIAQRTRLNEILVIPFGEDVVVIVGNVRLTDDAYRTAINVWKNLRPELAYIRLSCEDQKCICAAFRRTSHSNVNNGSWTNVGIEKCDRLPRLENRTFADFDHVKTFELSNLEVSNMEADAFSGMSNLELVKITRARFSKLNVTEGVLCHRSWNLISIQLSNVHLIDSDDPNDVLLLFSCKQHNRSHNIPHEYNKTDVDRLKVNVITVNYCGINRLHSNLFSSLQSDGVLSIDLFANNISWIDDNVFSEFRNLRELILAKNRLVQLPETLLEGLHALRYLELLMNEFETFSTEVFPRESNINVLSLAFCRLHTIHGSFNVTQQMIQIFLANNSLREIRSETFQNCTNLAALSLQNNQLQSIDPASFLGIRNLVTMQVHNNRLENSTAVRELFWNTETNWLTMISMNHNNLTILFADMFHNFSRPTPNINRLDLSDNAINIIHPLAFRGLSNLIILLLENNALLSLDPIVFRSLSSLSLLNLGGNRLVTLPESIFLSNKALGSLLVGNNLISHLSHNMSMPLSLINLDVENNRLASIPWLEHPLPNLELLQLGGNRIKSVSQNELARFPNVGHLTLKNNHITTLPEGVFANNSQLTSLTLQDNQLDLNFSQNFFHKTAAQFRLRLAYLSFSDNHISSTKDLFRHHTICNVLDLNISSNPLHTFSSHVYDPLNPGCMLLFVVKLFMRNCSLTSIDENVLQGALELQLLDVTDNLLTEFNPLKIHNKYYNVLLRGNPIHCTCRMHWLREREYSTHYNLSECYHAVTGQLARFDEIPDSQFLCKIDHHCTVDVANCSCFTDNQDELNIPTHLLCSNKYIRQFPVQIESTIKVIYFDGNRLSEFLSTLQSREQVHELYLCRNEIRRVDDNAFQSFHNAEIIDLGSNLLTFVSGRLFSKMYRLRHLFLNNNRISTIDTRAFDAFRALQTLTLHENRLTVLQTDLLTNLDTLPFLSRLSLHDNPWNCQCDNATFKYWIQSRLRVIDNTTEIQCNGTSLLKLADESFICYDNRPRVYVKDYIKGPLSAAVSSSLALAFAVIGLILVYRHRHVLQVRLYNTRFRLRFVRRRENEECDYDAAIFYDDHNDVVREWVENEMRPRLTDFDPQLRIMIPDLDLPPGVEVIESIVESVNRSRRTVIVLDRGSYDNPYVLYAFKFAYHHMTTDDNTHDILLVLTDDLDVELLLEDATVDSNFSAYLTAGKRLKISHQRFWQELNFFLPQTVGKNNSDTQMTAIV